MKLLTKLLITHLACSFAASASAQAGSGADPDWSKLMASMDKMHTAMSTIERSGNGDVDFVKLMLPHHQAAVDMAATQLLYGKDPQMRALAQKILSDQQSEITQMQRWLKQQQPAQVEIKPTAAVETAKRN
jgi:uncharacterized protein (DUF305 family)